MDVIPLYACLFCLWGSPHVIPDIYVFEKVVGGFAARGSYTWLLTFFSHIGYGKESSNFSAQGINRYRAAAMTGWQFPMGGDLRIQTRKGMVHTIHGTEGSGGNQ